MILFRSRRLIVLCLGLVLASTARLRAQGEWEFTLESEQALERGLRWLDQNQGPEGNWSSNDLGLVSLGALAFMAAGHAPGRGEYGGTIQRALDYVMDNAKPSGLLNIADGQRDLYNHGLATFVLGQAHGMTTSRDPRLNKVLDRALRLISSTQCEDGGWDYRARRQARGHDLSLAVMQAKALRSAMDSGLNVPPEVVDLAIRSVREHYTPAVGRHDAPESEQRKVPGQFTYTKGGGQASPAMAAAGVVCLQEFGQYDDWRIEKNVDILLERIRRLPSNRRRDGTMPFDAYSLYYVGQALYQVGGPAWREAYPKLRDHLVETQVHDPSKPATDGLWRDRGEGGGGRVSGKPGDLFGTSVACFVLAIPNRYLPILQEGKIESLRQRFGGSE
jgi:hypothetical protein